MTSWQPLDLSTIDAETIRPTYLKRTDGNCLLYPGRFHWIQGESESLKSWIAQIAVAEVLADGGRGAYVDFEDHASTVVARLLALGVSREVLNDPTRFVYIRPDETVTGDEAWTDLYAALDLAPLDVVVFDGVTEAMTSEDLNPNDNKDVAAWVRLLARPVADHTGAAVVIIDHVTKSKEGRNGYAIGGQHKKAVVDGAAYLVEVVRPFAPVTAGMEPQTGMATIRIVKDKPGRVRSVSINGLAATVELTSWPDGGVTWELTTTGVAQDHGLRQRIAQLLTNAPGSPKRAIRDLGNSDALDAAVASMVADGHILVEIKGSAHLHYLTPAGSETYLEGGQE